MSVSTYQPSDDATYLSNTKYRQFERRGLFSGPFDPYAPSRVRMSSALIERTDTIDTEGRKPNIFDKFAYWMVHFGERMPDRVAPPAVMEPDTPVFLREEPAATRAVAETDYLTNVHRDVLAERHAATIGTAAAMGCMELELSAVSSPHTNNPADYPLVA